MQLEELFHLPFQVVNTDDATLLESPLGEGDRKNTYPLMMHWCYRVTHLLSPR